MAIEQYDHGNPKQGISQYEILENQTEVTVYFKGSDKGYTRPLNTLFRSLLEQGEGATRYYTKNLR
jgi:hypothetical protein